jgi:hypothetical protein
VKNDGIINLTGERTRTYEQRAAELDEREEELRRIAANTERLQKLGDLAQLMGHLNDNSDKLRKLERVDNLLTKAKGTES